MPLVGVYFLLSLGICWLMVSIPSFTLVLSILWGILLLLGGYYLDRTKLLIMFVVNLLVIYFFRENAAAAISITLFGLPSLVMGLLLQIRRDYYQLLKWGMITALIVSVLFTVSNYYSLNQNGLEKINPQFENYVQESIQAARDAGLMKFYEEQGISQEDLEKSMISMFRSFVKYLPAFYGLQAIFMVYMVLVLSSYVARKRKLSILGKKLFREEIMPWQLAWVVIAGLALWLLGRNELSTVYYTGANLLVIAFPIIVYYGFAQLVHRISRSGPKRKIVEIVAFILFIMVLPIIMILFVGLLGLFGSLMDHRNLRIKEE